MIVIVIAHQAIRMKPRIETIMRLLQGFQKSLIVGFSVEDPISDTGGQIDLAA